MFNKCFNSLTLYILMSLKGQHLYIYTKNTYLHTFVYMYILKRTVFSIYIELTKYFIKAINMRGHIIATITKKKLFTSEKTLK